MHDQTVSQSMSWSPPYSQSSEPVHVPPFGGDAGHVVVPPLEELPLEPLLDPPLEVPPLLDPLLLDAPPLLLPLPPSFPPAGGFSLTPPQPAASAASASTKSRPLI
jgi:hypothetical protein